MGIVAELSNRGRGKIYDAIGKSIMERVDLNSVKAELDCVKSRWSERVFSFDIEGVHNFIVEQLEEGTFKELFGEINVETLKSTRESLLIRAGAAGGGSKDGDEKKFDEAVSYADELINTIYDRYINEKISESDRLVAARVTNETQRQTDEQTKKINNNTNEGFQTLGKKIDSLSGSIEKLKQEITASGEQSAQAATVPPVPEPVPVMLSCANEAYADAFNRVMFLHDEETDKNVTLKNLFVVPKYEVYDHSHKKYVKPDDESLKEYIRSFVKFDDKNVLLIEGDAGTGKSTLCCWMNDVYCSENDPDRDIFEGRRLITVRLRDLIKDDSAKEDIRSRTSLIHALREYLNIDSFEKLERSAVLLLDGFDELCMINDIAAADKLFQDLCAKLNRFKVIVTSRPKYIQNIPQSIKYNRVILLHFDADKKEEWVVKYTEKCKQPIDENIKSFITENPDSDVMGTVNIINLSYGGFIEFEMNSAAAEICDTPMILYMLAAKGTEKWDLDNSWAIYKRLFSEVITEAKYNRMFPDPDMEYSHWISKYKDAIYRVNEEIAYRMYMCGNSKFYMTVSELTQIVEGIPELENKNAKDIVRAGYALCSYWNVNSADGAVEFYHNNIRDFFLCEKIYREINALYEKRELDDEHLNEITKRLCSLFRYGKLENRVSRFMSQRVSYFKNKGIEDDYPFKEYAFKKEKHAWFPQVYENMLTDGRCFYRYPSKNPIRTIKNILVTSFQCFLCTAAILMEPDEKLELWNDVEKVNSNGIFRFVVNDLLGQVKGHSVFLYAMFDKQITVLNLSGVELNDASLTRTPLSYHDLTGANLEGADLRGASLVGTHLTNAHLEYADLRNARLFNAHLSGAHLENADLIGAHLENADLRGALLMGATLPDGFSSEKQEEQIEHLLSMNIKGLKL